jgi:hypothetical protein
MMRAVIEIQIHHAADRFRIDGHCLGDSAGRDLFTQIDVGGVSFAVVLDP